MNTRLPLYRRFVGVACLSLSLLTFCARPAAGAVSIGANYSGSYTFIDLGKALDVPTSYGGLVFKAGDANTLLLGGAANITDAAIYSVGLTRGAGNHVTGFSGTSASVVSSADSPFGGIDGGLTYGPGNVLFYTSYSDNYLGQIKPGSTLPDKLIDLTEHGIISSVGTVAFVPNSFSGGGRLKILSYDGDNWYDATISSDGSGTFNIASVGSPLSLPASSGPEGVIFVPAGNPQFTINSVLITEFDTGDIASYEIDANGDPVLATRKVFMSGLTGAQGAAIDPVTGDFLFSTFGTDDHIVAVRGFTVVVPEPSSLLLLGLPLAVAVVWRRNKRA